jgi:hypothetical protein
MRDAIQRMEARTPMTEASVGFIRVRKRKLKAEYHYLATMSSSFESPDRFARDLAVQLAGHEFMKEKGRRAAPCPRRHLAIREGEHRRQA